MPLTDAKARNAKPKSKQFKLFDNDGLFLLVSPAGGKWWRFKYRLGGKEKLISFGTYPEVSLAQARVRRDEARKQVADNIDPSQARKALKAAKVQNESTFEVVAREWHTKSLLITDLGESACGRLKMQKLAGSVASWNDN